MKRVLLFAFISIWLFIAPGSQWAIEIGLTAGSGNIHFPWDDTEPTTGGSAFPSSNYYWAGNAWCGIDLGEGYSIRISYERDPVLRNMLSGVFEFERGAAQISVGPFLGFLNGDERLASAGLTTSIRLQSPGLGYISVLNQGGLSLGLVANAASIPQGKAELAGGFYINNMILSASLRGKRFSQTDAGGDLVADNLTSYELSLDVYKKNVPYQLLCKAGYQVRSKYFQGPDVTEALGSVIMGILVRAQAGEHLVVHAGLDSSIFTFGLEDLRGRSPSTNSFLFDATIGVVYQLDQLPTFSLQRKDKPEE